MPVPLIGLPGARLDPRNSLVDFSPINEAIDFRNKLQQQDRQHSMEQERLNLAKSEAGRASESHGWAKESHASERETKLAQKFAGLAQMIEAEPDPAKRSNMLSRVYAANPEIKGNLGKYLPAELHDDPVVVSKYWTALAKGYQDPLTRQQQEANLAKTKAETTALGQKPTDIQKVGADDTLGQVVQNPDGSKRFIPLVGGKPKPIIKDGDKPLISLEPGADGQLAARTLYEGPQGNAQKGIEGGFRELHAIPDRYGGDNGTFSNAVGAFQGNPDSWVGTVARPIGSFMSNFATGPGNSAPPSEVCRAIEGATNTLAASLKPLIRKPGEGSWSDRDQAVLDSIVGNLSRANDVAQYDRELNNVRLRIKSNFGLDLPELVRKPHTDRLPTTQPSPASASADRPPVAGASRAPDGKWYVPDPSRPGKFLRVDP